MGSTKIILAGLLALAVVVNSAYAADKVCEYADSDTGKKACTMTAKKDEVMTLKCGANNTVWTPNGAFASTAGKVCAKELNELNATCATDDQKELRVIVPGIHIEHTDETKSMKIKNTQDLKEDKKVYAVCKSSDGNKGFTIVLTFSKTEGSGASTWATIPAVFLGSLTTLVALLRV